MKGKRKDGGNNVMPSGIDYEGERLREVVNNDEDDCVNV